MGDGTAERPLQQLPQQLSAGLSVHVSSGLYEGSYVLEAGAQLVGHGQVVLVGADADAGVLTSLGGTLENIALQGGRVGLVAEQGHTRAHGLTVSGHRAFGVDVAPGAALWLEGVAVEATLRNTTGVRSVGGSLEAQGLSTKGGFDRAVDVSGGLARLVGLRVEGAGVGLRVRDGARVELVDAGFTLGRGAAVFVVNAELDARGVSVLGNEFGVLGVDAGLTLQDLSVTRPQQSGVSAQDCRLTLRGGTVQQTGPLGGLTISGGTTTVDGLRVFDANAYGLLARVSRRVVLRNVTIERVRAESNGDGSSSIGDGLLLRDVDAEVDGATVRDVEGSGLYAAALANVRVGGLTVERARFGGIVADRASVTVQRLHVGGGGEAAINVPEQGFVHVAELTLAGSVVPVWASCLTGAAVELGTVDGGAPIARSLCVRAIDGGLR